MRKISERMQIILVDDDADDRELFEAAISEVVADYELITFKDGSEVIAHFKEEKNRAELPDILFLDINMPFVNGLEALEILRTEMRIVELPVAMYSTSSLQKNISEALIAGANVYITKPASFEKLVKVVATVLNKNLQIFKSGLTLDTFLLSV